MNNQPIKRLGSEIGRSVRAPAIIPSFSAIAEELVMNSLEGGAASIVIMINSRQLEIQCQDDGKGMNPDQLELVGEWNWTSKERSTTGRSRGESLAAISVLADVEITSKTNPDEGGSAYRKTSAGVSQVEWSDDLIHRTGTIATVRNVFASLPVRRNCLVIKDELRKVADFLTKIAMFHHKASFRLIEFGFSATKESSSRLLVDFQAESSVSHRFRAFHGDLALGKLRALHLKVGGVSVQGLIPPPNPEFLEVHRNNQYVYLNGKVASNVAENLDMWYSAQLRILPRKGYIEPYGTQLGLHPGFVLALSISSDCEVIGEQEITNALSLIKEAAVNMKSQVFSPKRTSLWTDEIQQFKTDQSLYKPESGSSPCAVVNIADSFRSAFVPTPGSGTKHKGTPNIVTDRCNVSENLTGRPCQLNYSGEFVVEEGKENDSDQNGVSDERAEKSPLSAALIVKVFKSASVPLIATPAVMFSKPELHTSLGFGPFTSTSKAILPFLAIEDEGSSTYELKSSLSAIPTDGGFIRPTPLCLSLHRNMLHPRNCHIVGQVDLKFLLLSTVHGQLLIGDQHAMDERQRLESLYHRVLSGPRFNVCGTDKLIALPSKTMEATKLYSNTLKKWGFEWICIQSDMEQSTVRLIQVPVILETPLSELDFIEYLHTLTPECCAHAQPPAVTRLLQSKACHSAIKFGDYISAINSAALVARLYRAELPFQCAHGRPSMVPLTILHSLWPKESLRTKRPRYENLTK